MQMGERTVPAIESALAADPRPHLPVLDGVRGLAILVVLISHAMRIVPRAGGVDHAGWQVLAAGWVGVDLFFVLSGFLITGILYDAKRHPDGYFINFYARRVLRIAPLYYGFLAVYFYVLPRIDHDVFRGMYVEPGVRPMFWFYLYNFWGAIHQGMHGNLGVFWSLCVEEHFYLVWPFVVWLLGRRSIMRVCVLLGAASFACRIIVIKWFPADHAAYLITPCRLDGLCAGAFAALAMRDPSDWQRVSRWAPRVALIAGGVVLGMALGQRHFLDHIDFNGENRPGVDSSVVLSIGLSTLAACFAGVLVVAVNAPTTGVLSTFLRSRWLRALGLYSYAIYVFHPLVITLTKAAFRELNINFPTSPPLALAARIGASILVLAITFLLGMASYHLFERHFLALKRYFPPAKRPAVPDMPRGANTQLN